MTFARIHPRTLMLCLAFAASLLELGPLVALISNKNSILDLLIAGLSYQVGNAMPRPAARSVDYVAAAIVLVAATLLMTVPVGAVVWFVAITLMSWSLQVARRNLNANVSSGLPTTAQKRSARVLGFVAATLVPVLVWVAGVLITIGIAVFNAPPAKDVSSSAPRGFGHPIEWTMLIHQTHYFSYAYAVPLLLAPAELGGLVFVGLWFACGWISYLSAESLWHRWPPQRVFIAGHLFLAVVLMLMSMTTDVPWITLILWILSGFGGGTVYCLTLLHHNQLLAHESLDRAEDFGHLIGVMIAIFGVLFLNWSAVTLPAVGSVWAIAAVLSMIAVLAFGSSQKSSRARSENQ